MVSLKDIAENIGLSNPEMEAVLNLKSGKTFLISDEELSTAEDDCELESLPEWQRDIIADVRDYLNNQDDYIVLPNQYEFGEYDVMDDFICSLPNTEHQNTLQEAIAGKGAFRRFKDQIAELGIAEQWYKYKDAALMEFAKEWAKENNVQFSE